MLVWSCQMSMDCRLGHLFFKAAFRCSWGFQENHVWLWFRTWSGGHLCLCCICASVALLKCTARLESHTCSVQADHSSSSLMCWLKATTLLYWSLWCCHNRAAFLMKKWLKWLLQWFSDCEQAVLVCSFTPETQLPFWQSSCFLGCFADGILMGIERK